jgi:hypothetical protein
MLLPFFPWTAGSFFLGSSKGTKMAPGLYCSLLPRASAQCNSSILQLIGRGLCGLCSRQHMLGCVAVLCCSCFIWAVSLVVQVPCFQCSAAFLVSLVVYLTLCIHNVVGCFCRSFA